MDVLHLIAGRRVEGDGAEFAGTDPARPSEVVARGRFASVPEVDRAVAAARDLGTALRDVDRLEVGVQGRAARDFSPRTVTVHLGAPA
ncbi:hypothetical protein ACFFR3_39875 [Nonomuraea salmonea]|jgi:hypothetical protein|uniref:Uncharacterized protein n=1 Tax=Nonomuraea salmonea TaxID=46181 RepID=A0ABV5NZE0_9ACTN